MKSQNNQQSGIINSINHMNNQLSVFIQTLTKTVNEFSEKYKGFFSQLSDPKFIEKLQSGFQEFTDKLTEETKHSIIILAQHGWFISLNMSSSEIVKCATSVLDDEIDGVDKIMTSYYRNYSDTIREFLTQKFPNRSIVLNDAFEAHNRNKFNLSIPIFLIQSDGICDEVIGIQLYSREKGGPKTTNYAAQFQHDSFMSALLEPFRIKLPISANERERESLTIENYLNRHEILHGENCNYGTEINSLKAISLINFVATVLLKTKNI